MQTLIISILVLLTGAIALPEKRYHPENIGRSVESIEKINPSELFVKFWAEEAAVGIKAHEKRVGRDGAIAKNIVLFLGDGMSMATVAAARTLFGQMANRTGEESQLSFETFPTVGLSKTYCVNEQIPDSACTATAYLCGAKTNFGTVGVTARVPRANCTASLDKSTHLTSIAAWALAQGKDVGIVTTARVTHASPSAAYAHAASRYWENDAEVRRAGHDPAACADIAHQLVHEEPGKLFKVILGGGRREFMSTTATGETGGNGLRTDGRDVVKEWKTKRAALNQTHRFVYDRNTLNAALQEQPEFLLGLFSNNHLRYAILAPETQPTLSEMTEAAIKILSKNQKGFFLFVEGGRIDHAHHDNQPRLALLETIELSKAVASGRDLLEGDSLIVVTSDHSHVMTFNGYAHRGSDILGVSDRKDKNKMPYMTLSYANGPGFRAHVNGSRVNITSDTNFRMQEWLAHSDVPLDSETHGGEDVAVYAWGPQHEAFAGVYEQTRIPRLMAYIGCVGDGPRAPACSRARLTRPSLSTFIFITILLTCIIL